MDTPPDHPVPDCSLCRDVIHRLEARILELQSKLRDLEEKFQPPPPKRPVAPKPPAPAKKPTGKKRGT